MYKSTSCSDNHLSTTTCPIESIKPIFVGRIDFKKEAMANWYQKMNAKFNGYTYEEPKHSFSFRYILH